MTDDAGEAATGSPPTCPVHPERETYVRCTRCDRPICADCMVPAPVGFQCPECVKSSHHGERQARTLAGGGIHGDQMLVTKILVGLNVALFALQYLSNDRVTSRFAMQGLAVALEGDSYRLVTSAFLHTGVAHLALNMLALWIVGQVVEPRLGRWRYLTVYLLSALGGSVLSYAVDSPFQASVGASGAVFGLFGALFVLMLRLRLDIRGVVWLIGINVVIGFLPGFNINWRAHMGGLVVGTVLTAAMVYAPQRHRLAISIAASVAVALACVGVTVWRTDQINGCVEGSQDPGVCLDNLTYLGAPASGVGGVASSATVGAAGGDQSLAPTRHG